MGYLDPEYFQKGLLTEKSDVYSFGVVLAELLTGQKPLSQTRPEEEKNLAIYFLHAVRRKQLLDILEPRIRNEASREQLEAVAKVIERCLSLMGEERATMREVATDLERLRVRSSHPWALASPDSSAASSHPSTGSRDIWSI
ncbi:unnamed protein product [Spirodela intermedia]|nr:unnamed protein product [Spirodela intermedia]CAA6654964.1 unnamed protein product [Spirodela intermedia]